MINPPSGTVTFLFTDIEGSTKRWEHDAQAMNAALARHDTLVRSSFEEAGGYVFKTVGDAFCAAFPTPYGALSAALAAQRALHGDSSSPGSSLAGTSVGVRMALHTGIASERDGDYFGQPVNRVARLLSAAHGGQVLLSMPTQELVRDNLPAGTSLLDMGEHRLKDLLRPEHIFQLAAEDLPSEFPPLNTLDARPNNLPTQPTLFIGREKEVDAVCKMVLESHTRLVTLTGTGGTGKTRLSLQAAAALIDRFSDGVFFVALAPVTDPNLVAATIALALGIGEAESDDGDKSGNLKKYLQNKEMLLVLDNFEQVVKAASLVSAILSASPRVKVLVTSREVLHLYGEKEYAVPTLAVPDLPGGAGAGPRSHQHTSVEKLTQFDSVRLFIERARLVKSDFEVTNENAPAVAEVCYRLDGLPLAIELAAARVKLLPPQAMLPRLQNRLKLLTGGARDLPTHQQTLRGAIAWSYDLLPAEEQALFRRMAVFAGGCTLEAAGAVCNYDNQSIDALDGISALLDKSLVRQADTEGEPRFFMLETLREYGLEQMEQSGELEEVRRAHVDFYLPPSMDWRKLAGAQTSVTEWQQLWDSLLPEMDNLRAASAWYIEHNTEDVMLVCTGLAYFWHGRGYHSEARYLVDKALALPGAAEKHGYSEALIISGVLAQVHGNMVAAGARFQSAIAALKKSQPGALDMPDVPDGSIAPGTTDTTSLGWALGHLAMVVASQEGPAAVLDIFIESLEELRASGDEIALARSLIGLGTAYIFKGDYDRAQSVLEESLGIGRRYSDGFLITASAQQLGDVARIRGDYRQALSLYQENMSMSRIVYLEAEIPSILHNMAYAELGQGNAERAKQLLMESLAAQRDVGNKGATAETLACFAALATHGGQAERAIRLYGAARAIWESNHLVIWPAEQVEYDRYISRALTQIDEVTRKKAWDEGYAMGMQNVDRALDYAQERALIGPKETGGASQR